MASTNVSFDIIANDRASDKFDHLSRSVDHSGGALGKFASIAGKAAKVGAVALAGGAVLAAKGLYEAAQGAVEDQAAAAKLATTLKTVAHATDGQIASTERWITAQGKAFGVADDDLRPSLQRLVEATHDVGKAQDLASLAMDVAAAKGKPLVTVSEALMKAYNGSIGGLSRLGVKTKDAEGDTISFTDAVKQMSDTFGGAASAHADTLAGKMEILKLNISEAGESIGYKLLPYISDAATWLGDHLPGALDTLDKKAGPVFSAIADGAKEAVDAVKPAVREIAEAFGHLTGSGSDVGDVWHDTLLPALSTTADMVGKVVNFIDELPGPVKKFGGEAAVAAIAVGQLNKVMAAIKASDFVTGMRDSEKRAGALGDAARSAAGVGGILALTSAMSDSADESDTLKHNFTILAGSIATGFAVAGPAGGAVGGLTAMVLAFKNSLTDAEGKAKLLRDEMARTAAAKEYADALDSVKDSLDQVSGAATANSRAWAVQQLRSEDAVHGLHSMGISTRTAVDAILGNKNAMQEVTKAYGGAHPVIDLLSDRFRHMSRVTRDSADAIYSLRERLGITKKALLDIPKDVRIRIKDDVPDSLREIEKLGARVGHLDRSTIRILLKAADLPVTKKNVDAVTESIQRANRESRKKITARFEESGLAPSLKGIARFAAARKNVDGKDIKTLIRVLGVETTVGKVRGLEKQIKATHPKFEVDTNAAIQDMGNVDKGLKILSRQLAKPKVELQGLPLFNQQMTSAHNQLVNLNGDHADTYIYTHHQDVYSRSGGGGGGGGGGTLTPRMVVPSGGSQTVNLPGPMPVHHRREQPRIHVYIGDREIKDVMVKIADEQIDQAESFARSQRD